MVKPIVEEIKEPEEEKTPEPPSHLSEIEKRKFKLRYSRKKLEKRKLEREQIRALKANKSLISTLNSGGGGVDGRSYVSKYMEKLKKEQAYIQNKINEALNFEEEELKLNLNKKDNKLPSIGLSLNLTMSKADVLESEKKKASLMRKPGRLNNLCLSSLDDQKCVDQQKKIQTFNKQCMTDPTMFEDYLREEFDDEFENKSIDISVIAGFMESQLKIGYPRELWEMEASPSPSHEVSHKIREKNRLEKLRQEKIAIERERRRKEAEAEKEKRRNMNHMNRKNASRLIKSGDFLINFRKKSKWIERTLGINMDFNESKLLESSDDDDDDDEEDEVIEEKEEKYNNNNQRRQSQQKQKEKKKKKKNRKYLKFRKKFSMQNLKGRAVGSIDFSSVNSDWFCATYFIGGSRYSTDNNGCIGVWNFMLPQYPEYLLKATNMITSSQFHPTNQFLVFGTTINGQILMWDLRNNKTMPIERTNFSNGHSSPVFTMSFLPNIKQKQQQIAKKKGQTIKKMDTSSSSHDVQHILSVSNDGKLCIWRTDQLSHKPLNQSTLKPSDDQSTARQIELITTCFDYSYRDHGNIILGSDEGYLYKAEIFSAGTSSSDSTLSIKESIPAHYGPITTVNHFPIQYYSKNYAFKENVSGLYLTSSYDWSVKLWHNKYGTKLGKNNNGPISIFDQMTDYVYDVKWNINGKPGTFACCDGEGQINLFDLTQDFKHPITDPIKISTKKNVAATTLQWTYDGKYLSCGDSDGNVSFYSVHKSISRQSIESCEAFQFAVNKFI